MVSPSASANALSKFQSRPWNSLVSRLGLLANSQISLVTCLNCHRLLHKLVVRAHYIERCLVDRRYKDNECHGKIKICEHAYFSFIKIKLLSQNVRREKFTRYTWQEITLRVFFACSIYYIWKLYPENFARKVYRVLRHLNRLIARTLVEL